MNQSQIKYARQRLTEIYKRRLTALRDAYQIEAVYLSCDEKLAALKKGDFTIKAKSKRSRHSSWSCNIEFPGERKSGVKPGFDKAEAKLVAEYTKINDELILGDNEAALKMLRDFDV